MHPVTEWECVLLDGPDEGKRVFIKSDYPPAMISTPRHLSPGVGWGGLEAPYHYEPMPLRKYTFQDYEPDLGYAEYIFEEGE